jgi:hypothetical protein
VPLEIVLPIVVVLFIARVVVARSKGRSGFGKVVVRCRQGHLFKTSWSPLGSLTAIRFGPVRYQYCPVGHHWSLVRRVNDADLTEDERRSVE